MNARKLLRIELSFHAADRFAQQIGFLTDVKPNVFAFGLDPVNLFSLQKKRAPTRFDHEPFDVIGPRLKLFKQRKGLLAEITAALGRQTRFSALQRLFKPRAIEWFYQVVDR